VAHLAGGRRAEERRALNRRQLEHVIRAAATIADLSIGLTEYASITRIATPSFASISCAPSASNTVTPAATTVATSSALERSVFDPPTVNVSPAP
jgi:hypothetical protein